MAGGLRVAVVDDNRLMRAGLETTLSSAGDLEVVASCGGADALAAVARCRPDVVLLDIRMPDVDGITVLRQLRELPWQPVVAMLTAFSGDDEVSAALRGGAAGYLLKDIDPEDLVRQVRALGAGQRPLAPGVTPIVIDGYLADVSAHTEARTAVAALTARERETLSLLGRGLSNAQIAHRMHIAPGTAKDYVSALLAKLGRVNRVQAAVLAERARLLTQVGRHHRRPAAASRPPASGSSSDPAVR
ncbi:response regulator [Streptomyces sp. NBC_00150]|uniref:Response regulator transcription factor n=2 Tax=unclassified Streptomyces TaxID=2593676 RepID=A0AAU2GTD1_9ACTN